MTSRLQSVVLALLAMLAVGVAAIAVPVVGHLGHPGDSGRLPAALPGAPTSAPPGPSPAPPPPPDPRRECVGKLVRAARPFARFSYVRQTDAGSAVGIVGEVSGPMLRALRRVHGCPRTLEEAAYTHQRLVRASNKAFDSRRIGSVSIRALGTGLCVYSDDEDLYRSLRPDHELGVDVAVTVVFAVTEARGSAPPPCRY